MDQSMQKDLTFLNNYAWGTERANALNALKKKTTILNNIDSIHPSERHAFNREVASWVDADDQSKDQELTVYVVGDLDGQLHVLIWTLLHLKLVRRLSDGRIVWSPPNPNTYVIQMGDQLDAVRVEKIHNKPTSALDITVILMMEYLKGISNGHILSVVGNHEIFNLANFTNYVGLHDQQRLPIIFRKYLFGPDGPLRQMLLRRPAIIKLQDVLFSHAGLDMRSVKNYLKYVDKKTKQRPSIEPGRSRFPDIVTYINHSVRAYMKNVEQLTSNEDSLKFLMNREYDRSSTRQSTPRQGASSCTYSPEPHPVDKSVLDILQTESIRYMVIGHNKVNVEHTGIGGLVVPIKDTHKPTRYIVMADTLIQTAQTFPQMVIHKIVRPGKQQQQQEEHQYVDCIPLKITDAHRDVTLRYCQAFEYYIRELLTSGQQDVTKLKMPFCIDVQAQRFSPQSFLDPYPPTIPRRSSSKPRSTARSIKTRSNTKQQPQSLQDGSRF